MRTVLTDSPDEAAEFIRRGGVVAFPTETVYGLGANVFDPAAVAKIFEAKRRPADNPLIVHIADLGQLAALAVTLPANARRLVEAFFPGPLTVVLERSPAVPDIATAGLSSVGVRMPRSETARRFLAACGTPVAAPSANLSGRPSPTTWRAVLEDLDGRIDCILKGDPTEIGLESTVVDCTSVPPQVLRTGSVSLDDLRAVVPETKMYRSGPGEAPRSPGLKHRHYAPKAEVVLADAATPVEQPASAGYIGLADRPEPFALKEICPSTEAYAARLFEFLRECDRRALARVYCEPVRETGIGPALMDRLRRAAE